MMTKTSVFLEDVKEGESKPIEFNMYIDPDMGALMPSRFTPVDWDNVMLMFSSGGYDIMFAWDGDNVNAGCLYKGHWNDGVVK